VAVDAAGELVGVIGLRVPGALAYRHLAIRLVSTACKIALEADDAVDEAFEPEVVSAFGEAFNNVAVHGHRGMEPMPVQIEVDWDDERLVITMIDAGRTFDPATVAPPDLDALPESGMGLFIMNACMDEVDYRPGPPNVLRLVKRRRRAGLLPPSPDAERGPGRRAPAWPAASGRAVAEPFDTRREPQDEVGQEPAETRGDRGSGVDVIAGSTSLGHAARGKLG
jgi:serine/threonine-protein kinase RsbW